ncbi:RNA polymerase sigma factor, partial [Streptomyces sp. NPDC059832]|uniref:RNA polymerase sigma factor n=1 Tax=Streptomyces sp. NPDC059832 TaxID=3346966 RepID=UPI00364E2B85
NTANNKTHDTRFHRSPPRPPPQAGTALPDHAEEVAGRVDDRRRLAAALTALAALRRPEREVLTLCLWEGLEYADAAEALGIPVGTVRSRLSRARAKLRKLADAELASAAAGRTERNGVRNREPAPGPGQVRGDRGTAIRPAQEGIR